MRRLLTLVVLSVLATPLASRADGSIQIVAAGGVAKAFGDVANGVKMADHIDWAFPLDGQLQFRILKSLALGAYVRYAPTSAASTCSGCSLSDLAFGGRLEYRFSDRLEGGPWLGVFGGYEQLKNDFTQVTGGPKVSQTLSGFEGGAAVGMDFELGGLTLGPYFQLTLGEYTKQSGTGVVTTSIASKGVHGFYGAGVRLALLL
jgi:hypothetical protein